MDAKRGNSGGRGGRGSGRGRGGGRGRGRGGRRGGGRGRGGGRNMRKTAGGRLKVSTARREAAEVEHLEKRVRDEVAEAGAAAAKAHVKKFAHLPLSTYTLSGLNKAKFTHMTRIQRLAIPHALAGRDVLGAAKTGSGKTLAFMVPVVEALFRARWSTEDGLGALVISPTRELAQQIFDVVRAVCSHHFSLTAGYVTGGKQVGEEARYIADLNILVATPGRLLHHLEQTPGFDASRLQVLVLDEADRLLDMGFEDQLNAIIGYLPPDRQTMLFSATQTKSVKDLARLSMRNPEFVAVHEKAATATPVNLSQHYTICPLHDKLNLAYSFIKSHLKAKTIVFVSSCKQARFVHEVIRRVRPGVSVMALHGKQKPKKRSLVYMTFLEKKAAVLFATDVAARGLDFPNVDWVLQLDCPDDTESYIHRVGRTARHKSKGSGLLVLLPSEAPAMVPLLKQARIPLNQIRVNSKRAVSVNAKIAAEVAADPELRQLAKKAFVSYLRSVYLQPNKDVFGPPASLPVREFALSLGLPSIPTTKFLEGAATRDAARAKKNASKKLQKLKASIQAKKKKAEAAAKAAAKAQGRGGSDSDSSGSGSSGSDSDSGSSGSDSDSDSDADGDLLRPAASASGGGSDGGGGGDDGSDVEDWELVKGMPEGLGPRSRDKVLRIAREAKELGRARAAAINGAKPFQDLAQSGAGATTVALGDELAAAAQQRVNVVARRLKARDAADRARERRRVKAKHLQERVSMRGGDDEDAAGAAGDGAGAGAGAVLLASPGSGSDASDGDSSGDSSDEDAAGSAQQAPQSRVRGTKRKRDVGPPESDSDSDSGSGSDGGAGAAPVDLEAAALRLLQRRRLVK